MEKYCKERLSKLLNENKKFMGIFKTDRIEHGGEQELRKYLYEASFSALDTSKSEERNFFEHHRQHLEVKIFYHDFYLQNRLLFELYSYIQKNILTIDLKTFWKYVESQLKKVYEIGSTQYGTPILHADTKKYLGHLLEIS